MNIKYQILKEHWGHTIEIAYYGPVDDPHEVCVECEDCNTILYTEPKDNEDEESKPVKKSSKPKVVFESVQKMSKLKSMKALVEKRLDSSEPIVDDWFMNKSETMSVNMWEDSGEIFFHVYGRETTQPIASGKIEGVN